MTSTFFCSHQSRLASESLIGSANNVQAYILIECPPPWESEAFDSKYIPSDLKILVNECKTAKLPIKFLLIANNNSEKSGQTKLLIYHRKAGLSNGYNKREFNLKNIEEVAEIVRAWFWGKNISNEVDITVSRDILVCTHGSHDKCCARYGNPFYYHAAATITDLNLKNVRIWKSTHFGGHRFAPTMIDLPEGRYYGVLEQNSFKSILTRTGNINLLKDVYRGWSIFPSSLQILERELLLRYGWDWFNYKVGGRIIEQSSDQSMILAELNFENTGGDQFTYQADILKDETLTVSLKNSCHAMLESVIFQYSIYNLKQVGNRNNLLEAANNSLLTTLI
ncbi:sucrase ferredoxin [Anabaena subtropica]|uniref:Sucrase ferredoxin n=1 Tax=Anabaena subtropica FACHB-260 TaxID=2692884 RepID=A0ABR8CI32_9NOST|nr:sucrase ferredoxin [Anabaena subtropica]MBD2342714.1 sucrase ferredoxin [Anabaena subtropica FACHB-260]